jgi:hypothetical protein
MVQNALLAVDLQGLIRPLQFRMLLASRMDALTVGRRFIAGTNGADKSGSPVRDESVGVGFKPACSGKSDPRAGFKPAPVDLGSVVPMGLNGNSLFAIT